MDAALNDDLKSTANLLRQRLDVIADTDFRDRDPEAHLEQLKTVSEAIFANHDRLKGRIHPRLEHFLAGCSYDKALAFIESQLPP